jgi:hypothetical protein
MAKTLMLHHEWIKPRRRTTAAATPSTQVDDLPF